MSQNDCDGSVNCSRGDEWSLRAFASMPSTAIFLRARAEIKNLLCELAREHEQASTRLNFASKSSKGKILRAVKNFNGPFITPCSNDGDNDDGAAKDNQHLW